MSLEKEMLSQVYEALLEKGYHPIGQIVRRQILAEGNGEIKKDKNGTDRRNRRDGEKLRRDMGITTRHTKRAVEICRKGRVEFLYMCW